MKNIINLPYPSSAQVMVTVEDRITLKTIIFKLNQNREDEIIHIAKLLGVSRKKIAKFMRKKIGDRVSSGEILASRQGIFSSSIIRSPISAVVGKLDLSEGTIGLIKSTNDLKTDFYSPVNGKVISIGKSAIEIEVENEIFQTLRGEGKEVKGDLKYIAKIEVGVLDSLDDIDNSIILCQSASEATLVKFSVLGVNGLIVTKIKREMVLPWVLVDDENFVKLEKHKNKKIWLRPAEKQVVILDE